jgi:hypothetical protein
MNVIDWENPGAQVSEHFTVHDCLWLPTWNRMATEEDGLTEDIQAALYALCFKMEEVRDFMKAPIIVHCMYRPPEYSALVGGSLDDVHTMGLAIDFHVDGLGDGPSCDKVRELLEPSLEDLNIRMERNPGGNWIHIDIHPVIHERYFNP